MAKEDPAGGGTDSARPRSSGVAASGNDGPCPAGSGPEAHRLTEVSPKGCTPLRRPPAGLSKTSILIRVSGGAHLHLYKVTTTNQASAANSRSFDALILAAYSLARFLIVVIILAAYAQQNKTIRSPKFHLQGYVCNKHSKFRICVS
jgi:hypothetical protein